MNKRLFLLLVVFFLFGLLLSAAVPKIFVVYSYDEDYTWNSALADAVQETLEKVECETQY
ncbi:MAG: hypothetical protein U9N62_08270 [Thermotogota bacterium]|nr:hypothetical protein [Thermotogota bacterium]